MIRGTSQTFKFKVPCNCSDIDSVKIIFWQEDYYGTQNRPLPITKYYEQCSHNNDEIYITLLPTETLSFTDKRKAYVQMIANKTNGESFGTKKIMFNVYPVYGDLSIEDNNGFTILDGRNINDTDNEYDIFNGATIIDG